MLSQPVRAGSTVLVLARTVSGGVELIGLDAGSGASRFKVPFHPGNLPPGIALHPTVTRDDKGRQYVVVRMQDHADDDVHPLALVDVDTGRVVDQNDLLVDDYGPCSDGTDVCTSGWLGGTDEYGRLQGSGPLRWDLETGRVSDHGPLGAINVGERDLFVSGEGRMTRISRLRGAGGPGWTQSVSLVVRPDADSAYGWAFEHDARADVYVGSLGTPHPKALLRRFEAGERVGYSLRGHHLTVGLDGRTGEQLWSKEGADPWCGLAGSVPAVEARTLCVVSGRLVQEKGAEPRYRDLVVTLTGIDPRSGETTWSHQLTGRGAQRAYANGRAPMAPYGVAVDGAQGIVALDLRDGTTEEVQAQAVLLCSAGPDRVTLYGQSRTAGTLYQPCGPDGRPTQAPLSRFGARAIPGKDDVRFVSMPGRVVAYDAAD